MTCQRRFNMLKHISEPVRSVAADAAASCASSADIAALIDALSLIWLLLMLSWCQSSSGFSHLGLPSRARPRASGRCRRVSRPSTRCRRPPTRPQGRLPSRACTRVVSSQMRSYALLPARPMYSCISITVIPPSRPGCPRARRILWRCSWLRQSFRAIVCAESPCAFTSARRLNRLTAIRHARQERVESESGVGWSGLYETAMSRTPWRKAKSPKSKERVAPA